MSENSTSETPQIRLGNRPDVRARVAAHADRLSSLFSNSDSATLVAEARQATTQDLRIERLKKEAVRAKENGEIDELTGLLNRKGFEKRLPQIIANAKRSGQEISVVYFDVNGLKTVNDKSGHQAGDELIKGTAGILQDNTRETDIVARFGGDEMVVVLSGANVENAIAVWEKMKLGFSEKNISVAAGIALLDPTTKDTIKESLDHADKAMYKAKQEGGITMKTTGNLTDDEILNDRSKAAA